MKNDTTTKNALTREEVNEFILLIRMSKIKELRITREDMEKLAPDMDKKTYSDCEMGVLNLNSRTLFGIPEPYRRRAICELGQDPQNVAFGSEEYTHLYWSSMLNEVTEILGFDRLIELFAEHLDAQYEALSPGQASALMKKLFERAGDGKALSSTTRSQLQQIKDKINKYQPLVQDFGSLFLVLDSRYPTSLGPSTGSGEKHTLQPETLAAVELEHAPGNGNNNREKELELQEHIKRAAMKKGLYDVEIDSDETFYFICRLCDHRKEVDLSVSVTKQQEDHHGKPMTLRVSSANSDY